MSVFIPPSTPSSDFPSDVLKWMKINAKPKMALKLMQCCKYFQHLEFPYFVVDDARFPFFSMDNVEFWHFINAGRHTEYEGSEGIKDLPRKLWFTGKLSLETDVTSILIPEIAVCDVEYLQLWNIKISFDAFKFFTASGTVTTLDLDNAEIIFENGDPVFFNEILKCVPNLENFYLHNSQSPILPFSFEKTFKEIDASNLGYISIPIPYVHFKAFKKFMDHNPHIWYHVYINDETLSDDEIQTLKDCVQNIINSAAGYTKNHPPPQIHFPGQNEEQYTTMNSLLDGFEIDKEYVIYGLR